MEEWDYLDDPEGMEEDVVIHVYILQQTDKALLVNVVDPIGFDSAVWVPKSMVCLLDESIPGKHIRMQIPEAFAELKNLI